MTTPGQVQISGETISGIKLMVGGLTIETVPVGLTWEQLASLKRKDRLKVELELIVAKAPTTAAKYDRDSGDETGAPLGELVLAPIREGFRITAVQTAEQREQAWREAHGAA